jgi:Ca-activated chloride channel family protein
MKRKSCTLFALLLSISSINVFGYYNLTVGDPRNSWWNDQGTIEAAEVHVRPQGIYTDFELFLTFSARNSYFSNPTDTVEVVLMFDLPQEAIVRDSWLWFGEDTLKARLLDKWTATSIYEGVVKRRRDPSILQKLYGTQYELRIFPMAGNETRKVKISFMLPAQWDKEKVSAVLLPEILRTSMNQVGKLTVIAWPDTTWKNPVVQGADGISFASKYTASLGNHVRADIGNQYFYNALRIAFDSPMDNGIYLGTCKDGEDGFYQMALMPSAFLEENAGQNVAVLFDYDASNTTLTKDQVLQQTRDLLMLNLTPRDSFNLFFSNINISRASQNWLPADSLNLSDAFEHPSNPLSSYSNLASLLSAGIEFIKSHGNKGKLVLISNASQYSEAQIANKLLNDIMDLMDPIFPIFIADYNNSYNEWNYINGRYYYGNEYLFSNLSRFTTGSYVRVLDGKSFPEVVSGSLQHMGGSVKSFDLYTRLSGGICYGRYNPGSGSDIVYLNSPVMQVGKFKGDFPFEINFSGEYNAQIISEEIILDEADIFPSDSLLESIWSGIYIQHMEKQPQTNDIISEIIHNSLQERVLSPYTAFLCIEEAFLPCEDCEENDNPTFLTDIEAQQEAQIRAYPNPFSGSITISLNLGENSGVEILQAGIYNLTGSLVFAPDPDDLSGDGETEFQWDGNDKNGNPLPAGIYIFVMKTDEKVYQLRLVRK